MELSQILGYTATFLFTIMIIPQVLKTLKKQSVEDVSIGMFIVALVANCIALWYALLINQNPLVIKYVLGIIFTLVYITIYFNIKGQDVTHNE